MVDKTLFLQHFEDYFARLLSGENSPLDDVARYCALDGGKRVRPVCVYLGALAAGGDCEEEQLLALASGVELVHSYSLVHDDLPSMDNGLTRRGKPSAHVAFGEANAVLGGDILLSFAFEHLAKCGAKFGTRFSSAAAELASAAVQMAHGQAIELAGIRTRDEYLAMCSKKTGALILGALRAGAIAAVADEHTLEKITAYGRAVGIVFQLADDLIDGDGFVAFAGRQETELELELKLLQAVQSASSFDPALADFAVKMARRSK